MILLRVVQNSSVSWERRSTVIRSCFSMLPVVPDDGLTLHEIAKSLGVTSRKVYNTLSGGVLSVLDTDQKKAVKDAKEMAQIISAGCITPESVAKILSRTK
jgi:DNA-binding phage protein